MPALNGKLIVFFITGFVLDTKLRNVAAHRIYFYL
jgi:hypothetical protein